MKAKQKAFTEYVSLIAEAFGIEQEHLFAKTKSRTYSTARHLLYYLCSKRPMSVTSIAMYMGENGYDTGHSSIIYGIKQAEIKVKNDRDYLRTARKIEDSVNK